MCLNLIKVTIYIFKILAGKYILILPPPKPSFICKFPSLLNLSPTYPECPAPFFGLSHPSTWDQPSSCLGGSTHNTFPLALSLQRLCWLWGFPGGASGKESTCQCRRREEREGGVNPWVRKIPWSRKWQLTTVSLPGKSMDRGAW